MILPETYEVADILREAGVRYWIFGGNGVELAVGRSIRPHDDLDVFVALEHASRAATVLEACGFSWHHGSIADGDVFYRRGELLLDLVPIDDGEDPPRTIGKLCSIALPAGLLEPFEVAGAGGPVTTLRREMHLAMKKAVGAFYGGAEREKDLLDARALGAADD